jgi:hypothetical protein
MQRVCKYELLLNSIASKERKRNSRLPNPDPVLEDDIKRLSVNAELLNAVLLKIDQKRSEVRGFFFLNYHHHHHHHHAHHLKSSSEIYYDGEMCGD